MEVFVRLMLPFGLAAIFVLAGMIVDSNYQRSPPEPIYIQATVVGFERPHRKQSHDTAKRSIEFTASRTQFEHRERTFCRSVFVSNLVRCLRRVVRVNQVGRFGRLVAGKAGFQ
jgi:hypothetical protein